MTDRMAIVPVEADQKMREEMAQWGTSVSKFRAAVAASPNAGKVAHQDFIACANMLMGRVNAPQGEIFSAAREFIEMLGLEIEE